MGLFGFANDGASIENVTLSKSVLYARENVGGIVGACGGTVKNATNIGKINSISQNVGGIAGQTWSSSTIENCRNLGIVSGSSRVGGVVGSNGTTLKDCYSPKGFSMNVRGALATVDIGVDDTYLGHIIGEDNGSGGMDSASNSDKHGGITIAPVAPSLAKNTTQTFTFTGTAANDSRVLYVAGGVSGSTVSGDTLTVAANETAKTLYVTGLI